MLGEARATSSTLAARSGAAPESDATEAAIDGGCSNESLPMDALSSMSTPALECRWVGHGCRLLYACTVASSLATRLHIAAWLLDSSCTKRTKRESVLCPFDSHRPITLAASDRKPIAKSVTSAHAPCGLGERLLRPALRARASVVECTPSRAAANAPAEGDCRGRLREGVGAVVEGA